MYESRNDQDQAIGQQPDYDKFSGIEELPAGWLQFLGSVDRFRFTSVLIAIIALAVIHSNSWNAAFIGVIAIIMLSVIYGKQEGSDGKNITPVKNAAELGDFGFDQGKP